MINYCFQSLLLIEGKGVGQFCCLWQEICQVLKTSDIILLLEGDIDFNSEYFAILNQSL